MDAEMVAALIADKLSSVALLGLGMWALWKRYIAASDKLLAALGEQTKEVVGGLSELKSALALGLGGLSARVDGHARQIEQHERTLGEHQRRLERHSEVLAGMSASGLYARPRLIAGEEDAPR